MVSASEAYVLFITGHDEQAVEYARKVCSLAEEDAVLRIVIFEEEAEIQNLIETPTLLRLAPEPKRQVTGDLSDVEEIARYLSGPWRPQASTRTNIERSE